jgi:hypothetical protein
MRFLHALDHLYGDHRARPAEVISLQHPPSASIDIQDLAPRAPL